MLPLKELHEVMAGFVDGDVDGAMVMTLKGSVLMSAGFETVDPKVTGAISANIWNYFGDATTPDLGNLQTLVFDCDDGLLALATVCATACFACVYSAKRSDPSALMTRLAALKTRLAEVPGVRALAADDNQTSDDGR